MDTRRLKIAGTIGLVLMVLLGVFGPVDRLGDAQITKASQRALVAFAAARGLNAAISAVQGTEVALQPAGIGLTLTPGELLDPVNDLVERLSWIMLASAVSLGVQHLLLMVGGSVLMSGLLVFAAGVCVLWLWRPAWRHVTGASWAVRLAVLTLVLRFAVPAYVLVADAFYHGFLAQQYTTATQKLEDTRARIEQAEGTAPSAPRFGDATSLWGRLTGSLESIRSAADLNGRVQRTAAMLGNLADHVINLAVVFVVQSLLLPLVFVWLLYGTLRAILSRRPEAARGL
jgi:hypothetical protein